MGQLKFPGSKPHLQSPQWLARTGSPSYQPFAVCNISYSYARLPVLLFHVKLLHSY